MPKRRAAVPEEKIFMKVSGAWQGCAVHPAWQPLGHWQTPFGGQLDLTYCQVQGPPEDELVLCIDLSLPLQVRGKASVDTNQPQPQPAAALQAALPTNASYTYLSQLPLQGSQNASCCLRLSPRSNTAARPATALTRFSPAGVWSLSSGGCTPRVNFCIICLHQASRAGASHGLK